MSLAIAPRPAQAAPVPTSTPAPPDVAGWALLLGTLGVLATNVLVLAPVLAPVRATVAFATVALVPGSLLLRLVRADGLRGWERLVTVVPLSLLAVMLGALPVALGPDHSLSTGTSLLVFDVLVVGLAVANLWRLRPAVLWAAVARADWSGRPTALLRAARRPSPLSWLAIALGAGSVVCAAIGARRITDGRGSTVTEIALAAGVAAIILAALAAGNRRSPATTATVVYLVAVAFLLASSLRGSTVTGHDIKIEYRVLIDTFSRGSWRPAGAFPGYNSCLSLTVLPSTLIHLLAVTPMDIFRVCFQVCFALVAVGVFLLARRVLPDSLAALAAGLLVAFPTYLNDMPMLNRQEIALLFFTAGALAMLRRGGTVSTRVSLLALLAVGLVLSHYATTYTTTGLLIMAWLVRQARRVLSRDRRTLATGHTLLLLPAVILAMTSAIWANAAGSSTALGQNLGGALDAVTARITGTQMAGGLRPELIAGSNDQALVGYSAYLHTINPYAPLAPPDCQPQALPAQLLPTTNIGAALTNVGVDPGLLNRLLRMAAAGVFEGGAMFGGVLLLVRTWRRDRRNASRRAAASALGSPRPRPRRQQDLRPDLIAGALIFLTASAAVPALSATYGLQRLYQQLLILLAPVVIAAVVLPLRSLRFSRRLAGPAAGLALLGCLATTTGLAPIATGGYTPQLTLSNAGPYYLAYYSSAADNAVATWIAGHVGEGYVITDSRDAAEVRSITHLTPEEGIMPGAIPSDGYLSISTPDGFTAIAIAIMGDRIVQYSFPLRCAAQGRHIVYAHGTHLIYGPVGQ